MFECGTEIANLILGKCAERKHKRGQMKMKIVLWDISQYANLVLCIGSNRKNISQNIVYICRYVRRLELIAASYGNYLSSVLQHCVSMVPYFLHYFNWLFMICFPA